MPRKISTMLVLALALIASGSLVACGEEEEELIVEEGEPLELGDLLYNVQLTRLLNPSLEQDRALLRGLPDPAPGKNYLAVFIRIQNEGEAPQRIPSTFPIETSREETFQAIDFDNPFAVDLGAEIPPEGEIPAIGTPAESGPIKGAMLLYEIDEEATQNRPLELLIPAPGSEHGIVELDL